MTAPRSGTDRRAPVAALDCKPPLPGSGPPSLPEDAAQLHDLNARIRSAAMQGMVDDMMMLIERRRRFLDALPPAQEGRSPALIAALDEAVRENEDLVLGLEAAMQQARTRGQTTRLARSRYRKTQTSP